MYERATSDVVMSNYHLYRNIPELCATGPFRLVVWNVFKPKVRGDSAGESKQTGVHLEWAWVWVCPCHCVSVCMHVCVQLDCVLTLNCSCVTSGPSFKYLGSSITILRMALVKGERPLTTWDTASWALWRTWKHKHADMYVYTYVWMYVCMYVCTCVRMYTVNDVVEAHCIATYVGEL